MFDKLKINKTDSNTSDSPTPDMPVVTPVEYKIISLDLIDDPGHSMRTDITPENVADLVLSIKQMGIIEPLIVFPKGERYEIIAGHRRRYAAELAKLAEVPCHVHTVNQEQVELMKIHENLYRRDIRPSDEMQHYNYIMKRLSISPTKLAQLIGKSDVYVSERLAIANYEPELREALDTAQINFSVAKELSRLGDRAKTIEYLRYAIQNGLTQVAARQWVHDYKRSLEIPKQSDIPGRDPITNVPIVITKYACIRCESKHDIQDVAPVYICNPCLSDTYKEQQAIKDEQRPPNGEAL